MNEAQNPTAPATQRTAEFVRELVHTLARAGFRLAADNRGSEIVKMADVQVRPMIVDPANPEATVSARMQAYNAACLSGYDPALNDSVRLRFVCDGNNSESVQLSFNESDLASVLAPDTGYAAALTPAQQSVIPETLKRAIAALEELQFCVRGFGGGAYIATIPMTLGTKVLRTVEGAKEWTGAVIGIRAELTWYGD